MRPLFCIPFALVVCSVAPSAADTINPVSARSERVDRAYDLVGGEWQCKTSAGTTFARMYTRGEDAVSIVAETDVTVSGHTGKLMETYHRDRKADTWIATLVGGQLIAVASPWYGSTWEFTGQDSEPDFKANVRMTYRTITANRFSREFSRIEGRRQVPYSGEECVRSPK